MYRWILALALTVGVGFAVVGCGGGEEPEKGGPHERETGEDRDGPDEGNGPDASSGTASGGSGSGQARREVRRHTAAVSHVQSFKTM